MTSTFTHRNRNRQAFHNTNMYTFNSRRCNQSSSNTSQARHMTSRICQLHSSIFSIPNQISLRVRPIARGSSRTFSHSNRITFQPTSRRCIINVRRRINSRATPCLLTLPPTTSSSNKRESLNMVPYHKGMVIHRPLQRMQTCIRTTISTMLISRYRSRPRGAPITSIVNRRHFRRNAISQQVTFSSIRFSRSPTITFLRPFSSNLTYIISTTT